MKIIRELFSLLSKNEKRNFFILCILMVINATVQVFGIASVAPLIAIIVNPESMSQISHVENLYNQFEFNNHHDFSIFLGLLILGIMIIGNSIIMLTNYLSLRYANNREKTIGQNLLKTYIRQPYIFFLNNHSTKLLRNVHNEVAYIASNIISRLLNLMTFGISAFGIVLFIFIINPFVTLILFSILGGAYALIYLLIKKKIYSLGKRAVHLTERKLKSITNSVHLIKDIKMNGLEKMFLGNFDNAAEEYSKIKTNSEIASISPKYIIEVVAIVALVFCIIYILSTNQNKDSILPLLGIYAFAGFKLMPALQQIFLSLSKIQFSAHSLELIAKEMELKSNIVNTSKEASKPINFKKEFGLDNVSFSYSNNEIVVNNLTLSITKNQKIGLIGKSGEGKSTIIDLLVGLTTPQTGHLIADNKKIKSPESWQKNISYIPQNGYLLDDSVDMNITLEENVENRDKQRLKSAKELALVDFDQAPKNTIGENGKRLSGGQKQRIGIARALYSNKPIIILDEATSAMDQETEREILKHIEKLDKTIIFISHKIESLSFCDNIYLISSGSIASQGSYRELEESSKEFKDLLRDN